MKKLNLKTLNIINKINTIVLKKIIMIQNTHAALSATCNR